MNGITRGHVIELCESNGIICHQKNFSLFDVYGADEAFVTGTFGGLTPVTKIDGIPMNKAVPGSVTQRLSNLYIQLISAEINQS